MSTPDRYRTATLPASYDFATNTTRTHASVCNDCGTLVLDQNTHDTWHTIQTATHLRDGDTLVLTAPADMTPEGLDHLNDTLERRGIADRVLIFSPDLNPRVLPRPADHQAYCLACPADFAAPTEQGLIDAARGHCDNVNATGTARHHWVSGPRPPAAS